MLIHKETMGVLEYIWTGQFRRGADGLSEPVNRPAKLAELPELDPAQWWELSGSHPLARKILKHYPWLTPVVGEQGELLDVEVVPDAAQQARLMRETAAEGKAVVMVLHDLNLALGCAHRVAVMEEGRLRAWGTPAEIYAGGALEEVFGVRVHRVELENGTEQYLFTQRGL